MRATWVMHGGELIPKAEFLAMQPARPRGPMVITDTCEGFSSQADGKTYESRRAYRADLKARGMVETEGCGLPTRPLAEPALTTEAMSEAWDQFDAGHGARVADGPPTGWEGDVTE